MSLEIEFILVFSVTQPELNKLKSQGTNYLEGRPFLLIALKCRPIKFHQPMHVEAHNTVLTENFAFNERNNF